MKDIDNDKRRIDRMVREIGSVDTAAIEGFFACVERLAGGLADRVRAMPRRNHNHNQQPQLPRFALGD